MSALRVVKFLKLFVPPIFPVLKEKFADKEEAEEELFDGDSALFLKHASGAKVYAEYGVGLSTVWMVNNTSARIVSVDTSLAWVQSVREKVQTDHRLTMIWIDLGDLGSWGWPVGYSKLEKFRNYPMAVWDKRVDPDVVLIDGRFRVACFFATLLNGSVGTKILFDDYNFREQYKIVETIISPIEKAGRQALFVIPDAFDRAKAGELLEKFEVVIE